MPNRADLLKCQLASKQSLYHSDRCCQNQTFNSYADHENLPRSPSIVFAGGYPVDVLAVDAGHRYGCAPSAALSASTRTLAVSKVVAWCSGRPPRIALRMAAPRYAMGAQPWTRFAGGKARKRLLVVERLLAHIPHDRK